MKRRYRSISSMDDDPLSGMANLFDLAMVFALALMVAMVTRLQLIEIFTQEDITLVKNPGKKNMEIIVKKGNEIERYKASGKTSEGQGKRIGSAFQLEDGKIIYVPE